MNFPRKCCSCKGARSCLICEKEYNIERKNLVEELKSLESFVYCIDCNKLFKGWDVNEVLGNHKNHNPNDGKEVRGFYIKKDFLTPEEEEMIMMEVDSSEWDDSQSGRRKQNFGPKVNFRKKKILDGNFNGFPKYTKFVQDKFKDIPVLSDFITIELCFLEYDPSKGAHIDPHIDDCWVWGERVLTVNLLSDSVLTLTKYKASQPNKYNLDIVDQYKESLIENLEPEDNDTDDAIVMRIPMPKRSLLAFFGPPRYQWEHFVLREDIENRRVCIAYREFTKIYLPDGSDYDKSSKVLELAQNYW